jgi:hypothetical protein
MVVPVVANSKGGGDCPDKIMKVGITANNQLSIFAPICDWRAANLLASAHSRVLFERPNM